MHSALPQRGKVARRASKRLHHLRLGEVRRILVWARVYSKKRARTGTEEKSSTRL